MDPKAKQKTLQMFSNGMYIVTSGASDCYAAGTITWVSQASFKPPLVMAAVRTDSHLYKCLRQSGVAVIHVLASHQQLMAQKFFLASDARKSPLNGEPFTLGKTLAPVLSNLPNYVECRVRQVVDDGGDHSVAILEVVEAECRELLEPLTVAETPWKYGG